MDAEPELPDRQVPGLGRAAGLRDIHACQVRQPAQTGSTHGNTARSINGVTGGSAAAASCGRARPCVVCKPRLASLAVRRTGLRAPARIRARRRAAGVRCQRLHDGRAVHQPLGHRTAVAAPQNVGVAVAVEVADLNDTPAGIRCNGGAARRDATATFHVRRPSTASMAHRADLALGVMRILIRPSANWMPCGLITSHGLAP